MSYRLRGLGDIVFKGDIGPSVVFGLGFTALAWLSGFLEIGQREISAFWFPSGYALAFYVWWPRSRWPYMAVAQALAMFGYVLWESLPLSLSLPYVVASVLPSLLGALACRAWARGDACLDSAEGFVSASIILGLGTPGLAALIRTVGIWFSAPRDVVALFFQNWFNASALSALALFPLFLCLLKPGYRPRWPGLRLFWKKALEFCAISLLSVLWFWYFFYRTGDISVPYKYLAIAFFIWVGLRFSLCGVALYNALFIILFFSVQSAIFRNNPGAQKAFDRIGFGFMVFSYLGLCDMISFLPSVILRNLRAAHLRQVESEARLHDFIRHSHGLFYRLNANDGRAILLEGWSMGLSGHPLASFLDGSSKLDDLLKDESGACASLSHPDCLEECDGTRAVDYLVRGGDGEDHWMRSYPSCYRDAADGSLITQGVLFDVSGQKESEGRLAEAQARYLDLVETSQDLIWQCDAEYRLCYLNPAWSDFLGFDSARLLNQDLRGFVGQEARRRIESIVASIEQGGFAEEEIQFITQQGGVRNLLVRAKRRLSPAGKDIGLSGTAYDVTQRRQMEEALKISQKIESLGVLAGGIAHDFNNLLGGIFGYIEIALRCPDPQGIREYLKKSLAPFERLKDLTHQLLTFSRGGNPCLKKSSLRELLVETVEFCLSGTNVRPHFEIEGDLPNFDFDPNQIGQVIQNIVINSRDAMSQGGQLWARAQTYRDPADPAKGPYVRIELSDDGPGIPPEILHRIFDPFFTTKSSGSGLGLAICYSIVAKHGGSIQAFSLPGRGARFVIDLPIVDSGPGAGLDGAEEKDADQRGRGGELVLLMDDEDYILEIVGELLRDMKFEVVTARDGERAMDRARELKAMGRQLDFALLDLTVPGGMGGMETAPKLRQLWPSGLRIIAVSGYAENAIISQPREYGFDASLAKPFRFSEFQAMIRSMA